MLVLKEIEEFVDLLSSQFLGVGSTSEEDSGREGDCAPIFGGQAWTEGSLELMYLLLGGPWLLTLCRRL